MTEILEQSRLKKVNKLLLTGKTSFKNEWKRQVEGGKDSIQRSRQRCSETSMGTGLDKSMRFLFSLNLCLGIG